MSNINNNNIFETEGYPLEFHKVQTEDGYILTLFRIPGAKSPNPAEVNSEDEDGNDKSLRIRQPILLVHGFLSSGELWFVNKPENSLPYILANEGYDCWIANLRGSPRSKSHITLETNSKEFWDFSLDELAMFDIPGMIDYILETTRSPKLSFVSHSMGNSVLCMTLSIKPEYCAKIKLMVALAPAVYLKHLDNTLVKMQIPIAIMVGKFKGLYKRPLLTTPAGEVMKKMIPFKNSENFIRWILETGGNKTGCCGKDQVEKSGYNTLAKLAFPASTSVKIYAHMNQTITSGKCQSYDYGKSGNMKRYGQQRPPTYDLNKVEIPVVTFASDADQICTPKDVNRLAQELPNIMAKYRISHPQFFHSDFLFGKDAVTLVYQHVIEILRKSVSTTEYVYTL